MRTLRYRWFGGSLIVTLMVMSGSGSFAQESEGLPVLPDPQEVVEADSYMDPMQTTDGNAFVNEKLAKPITLTMRDRSLREILMRVAELAGIELVYNDERVSVRGVSIAVERKPVQYVLDELLLGRGINYVVSSRG